MSLGFLCHFSQWHQHPLIFATATNTPMEIFYLFMTQIKRSVCDDFICVCVCVFKLFIKICIFFSANPTLFSTWNMKQSIFSSLPHIMHSHWDIISQIDLRILYVKWWNTNRLTRESKIDSTMGKTIWNRNLKSDKVVFWWFEPHFAFYSDILFNRVYIIGRNWLVMDAMIRRSNIKITMFWLWLYHKNVHIRHLYNLLVHLIKEK